MSDSEEGEGDSYFLWIDGFCEKILIPMGALTDLLDAALQLRYIFLIPNIFFIISISLKYM